MKTSMISSILFEKINIMHHWNEVGALHNLNDILCMHMFHTGK
jgi:hypothetical protein